LSAAYTFAPKNPRTSSATKLPAEDEIIDSAFGTLTIGTEGEAKFVGSFAGSEYLRNGDDGSEPDSPMEQRSGMQARQMGQTATPPASATDWGKRGEGPRAAYAEGGLPLMDSVIAGGGSGTYDLEVLRKKLPDWETEGKGLVESYWDNVNWM
jgi:hypothetical protein